MSNINSLDLLMAARNKQAVVAAPKGQPQFMPPPGAMPPGMPPMDPSMAGGMPMPPMDPAMMQGGMPMDPAMMGGAPPMDPAMMQGGMPPMDPAMMGEAMPPEGMPPPAPAMNIEQEITDIKEMLQALMESQIALMQTLGGGMPAPQGMPMNPAMMQGGMPPMDPAMMQGMQVTASHTEPKIAQDKEFADYMRTIADLLR